VNWLHKNQGLMGNWNFFYFYNPHLHHFMIEFWLNNRHIKTDLPPGMVVLDFVRYEKNLKGTKIGCREGDCGACTVLVGKLENGVVDYQSHTSCLMPIGNAAGKHIVTVEGINMEELNPVQRAIVEEGGTQCGFCTVGFVMSMVGFCLSKKEPDYETGIAAIDGNICRCTGYKSLERAIGRLSAQLQDRKSEEIVTWLVKEKFIPAYFSEMPERLAELTLLKNEIRPSIRVGGGTDLYVQKHDAMVHADIDFVFDKPGINGIKRLGNRIEIGGAATVEDLRKSDEMSAIFPRLKQHLKLISSTPIRNMATLAGNFVNASPIGDITIFFLALDARLKLKMGEETREIGLKDLYLGYKTLDKKPEEEIDAISFEVPDSNWYFNFEKVCKRTHLDIASVNSAIGIQVENGRIQKANVATGGVFAFPKFLVKTSEFLVGKPLSAPTILEAAELLQSEISPISDARGDAAYKRLLARQLFLAHFVELFPEHISVEELWENALG
jgi:xanthine dehydrogenase small subunit